MLHTGEMHLVQNTNINFGLDLGVTSESRKCIPPYYFIATISQCLESMDSACFGIEIEAIVEPHTLRAPLNALDYYERLTRSLRKRGQGAKVDSLRLYKNAYESFDKWLITRDGSLDGHGDNQGNEKPLSCLPSFSLLWCSISV